MTGENWADPNARAQPSTSTATTPRPAEDGAPCSTTTSSSCQRLVGEAPVPIPASARPRAWRTELDTYDPGRAADPPDLHAGDDLTLGPGSILVLQAAAAGS
jgi:hypothetical protein